MRSERPAKFRNPRSGFTLLELLAVLAVMTILGGMGMAGLGMLSQPRALDSAQSQLHALLRVARSQAVLNGTDSRLIINLDKDDPDRFLRFAGIVTRHPSDPSKWKAVHPGTFLPQGVYVVPQPSAAESLFDGGWKAGGGGEDHKSDYHRDNAGPPDEAVCTLAYPRRDYVSISDPESVPWICFQFGPDGRIEAVDLPDASGGLPPVSNEIVLASGSTRSDGTVSFGVTQNMVGILIKRNGHSMVTSNSEIF